QQMHPGTSQGVRRFGRGFRCPAAALEGSFEHSLRMFAHHAISCLRVRSRPPRRSGGDRVQPDPKISVTIVTEAAPPDALLRLSSTAYLSCPSAESSARTTASGNVIVSPASASCHRLRTPCVGTGQNLVDAGTAEQITVGDPPDSSCTRLSPS